MELPTDSPYFSPSHGIDKAAIVRHYLARANQVAFAGDGYPDVEAATLAPAGLRFARSALADVLSDMGLEYYRFDAWSEVADRLVADRNRKS
jgi:2-hydroxy-3-keto-5-methylthiopentenyl-1-phosphate phosphatase